MHWYLAIICDPEHTLLPPLPPTPSKVISTRRRTRQIDDIEKHPLDSTPPQGPADDDVRMEDIPRSPSRDAPDEEMKELDVFKDSCSISSLTPDGSKPVSVSSSDGGEKLFTESSDVDIPDLNYPSPQLRSRSMEIDIDVPEHDVISLSSKKDSSLSIISDSSTSRVDELSEATTPNSRAISASSFYGSASNRKGKRKASYADVVEVIDESVDDQRQEEEVDEMLTVSTTSEKEPPVTCVFTLDSLGSRHPQALKTLKQYLKMEAKDKKNAGECREPFGKNALVPMQPNYCDCGVYLLHFAMTFMKDPERHCRNVREKKSSSGVERKVVWEESDVGSFRENLASRIQELSKVWKAGRAAKEEGKNKGSEHRKPSADQDKAVSSDSEVDIVEDISAPEVVAPPKPKQKPAARMRG
ncbi:hypothetical protein SERLADRAFT_470630 [Serpula lacrymans var. lacrymans S7.9]|uniref:Ubiquitin-like protease family profile domain-containing protein n=1 Tax=Serpula lacrymans var. lacrymans (strain S7.9) TaxID=578457 RepID=F8NZJ4_SERL9|nr:uncharacterized protein SERLADRAFT_470630 [Serpula lacrymans var. lacrymans S7.9]EGO24014.1 hypothetical protein SERLADRAFT_470630 [Serpula lacrymans var. lacrymans S7.9]